MPAASTPKKQEDAGFMVATESFAALVKGVEHTAIGGETVLAADHPLVKAHPQFFTPVAANQ